MGFTWTPISSGTFPTKSHMQELKDNLNTLYSNLQLPQYAWSELADIPSLTFTKSTHFQELRNAADYAKDQNYCRAHDATKYDTYNNDLHSTYKSSNNSSIKSAADNGYDISYEAAVKSSNNLTVYSSN